MKPYKNIGGKLLWFSSYIFLLDLLKKFFNGLFYDAIFIGCFEITDFSLEVGSNAGLDMILIYIKKNV